MATRARYLLNVQGVGAAHVQQVTRELGFNDLVLIAPYIQSSPSLQPGHRRVPGFANYD